MQKIVLILSGPPLLKNKFDAIIKGGEDPTSWRYHRWNCNASNLIKRETDKILDVLEKPELKDSENADKFSNEVMRLADKHFGFKENYLRSMIDKFKTHGKTQLLVLHSVGRELSEKLKGEGVHTLHLAEAEEEVNPLFEYTIFDGESFEEKVLDLLKSLE